MFWLASSKSEKKASKAPNLQGTLSSPFSDLLTSTIMGIKPTDLGHDFVKSGMRLITQPSSDSLLKKAAEKPPEAYGIPTGDECAVDFWDPSTGPQEPAPECND